MNEPPHILPLLPFSAIISAVATATSLAESDVRLSRADACCRARGAEPGIDAHDLADRVEAGVEAGP